ncbi:DNA alkylation repair protein [Opitutus sp. GAS368]|jgi:3-methyladenine DNA glycosylase AlkD|uniref:DNA alkylation repair protein n=1 Tax=Opitutus sp. GAS368 TaxID=1882749 RepID=UPI000879F7BB|nr:DNA alkylation repair protein [Opitutus sp. GAS368]SDS59455.1 3-methyladenine DNA glycosylase AlkD [Opitutus sp. GAS368]
MKLKEAMAALQALGSPAVKTLWLKHGAKEPFFGVKIGDLQPLAKKLKGDQALALELYATGNGDAQYLAGMFADGAQMTAKQLQSWADLAAWRMISATIVPWVASEHPEGFALARAWTDSKKEPVVIAGWNTLGALGTILPDDQLPIKELGALLDRIPKTLPAAPNRVRQAMNGFVIAIGTYVAPLAAKAIATARKLGKVEVDVGDTDCKIPEAEAYILKSRRGAAIAPKRKTVRC